MFFKHVKSFLSKNSSKSSHNEDQKLNDEKLLKVIKIMAFLMIIIILKKFGIVKNRTNRILDCTNRGMVSKNFIVLFESVLIKTVLIEDYMYRQMHVCMYSICGDVIYL